MIDPETITHKTALAVFQAAFIRRVGAGPGRLSYGDLSDSTGIPVRTLKSWREGAAMPQLESILRLGAAFGPTFVNELLQVIGQGGAEYLDRAEAFSPMGTTADLVGAANEITERLRDGDFSSRDAAEVGPRLLELAVELEAVGKAMIRDAMAARSAAGAP